MILRITFPHIAHSPCPLPSKYAPAAPTTATNTRPNTDVPYPEGGALTSLVTHPSLRRHEKLFVVQKEPTR